MRGVAMGRPASVATAMDGVLMTCLPPRRRRAGTVVAVRAGMVVAVATAAQHTRSLKSIFAENLEAVSGFL